MRVSVIVEREDGKFAICLFASWMESSQGACNNIR